jgi:hypothetical protein
MSSPARDESRASGRFRSTVRTSKRTWARLCGAAVVSCVVVALVLVTGLSYSSRIGAPAYWPWVLTGLQVTALWAAGAHRWWGWPLGASVQPPWIAYAAVTDQLGFIPGCLFSGAVQSVSFVRDQSGPVPAGPPPSRAQPLAASRWVPRRI